MENMSDAERKRYDEFIRLGTNPSYAEGIIERERERAKQTTGQEQNKYKKTYPQKTATPPRPKPTVTTPDKKPSLLGRLASGFVAVSKNMQEAEAWKRKHVVKYGGQSMFSSSPSEKTSHRKSNRYKKKRVKQTPQHSILGAGVFKQPRSIF